MNRIIKFRAWNLRLKHMTTCGLDFSYESEVGCHNAYDEQGRQIEDVELMQFTGLKDKNGTEIYEGDIVGVGFDSKWIVEWDSMHARFDFVPIYNSDERWPVNNLGAIIIGNKFQNPELLGGKE